MFLTKTAWRKLLLLSIVCFAVAGVAVAFALLLLFFGEGEDVTLLFVCAGVLLFVAVFELTFGRVSEGVGRYLRLGVKYVYREMDPAPFLRTFEELRASADLVARKPNTELYRVAAVAYQLMGDDARAVGVCEELYRETTGRAHDVAALLLADYCYLAKDVARGDGILAGLSSPGTDDAVRRLAEQIRKSDRYLAVGDAESAAAFYREEIGALPKNAMPVVAFLFRYVLAESYRAAGKPELARPYDEACAAAAGKNALRDRAAARLREAAAPAPPEENGSPAE